MGNRATHLKDPDVRRYQLQDVSGTRSAVCRMTAFCSTRLGDGLEDARIFLLKFTYVS